MSSPVNSHQHIITPATIVWQTDDLGRRVPYAKDFADVYYSVVDGLAESRHVFINNNHLPERFTRLFNRTIQNFKAHSFKAHNRANSHTNGDINNNINNAHPAQTFTIGELGFGTGLNLLVTWQLWQHIKAEVVSANFGNTQHNQTQHNHIPQNDAQQDNKTLAYHLPRLHIISTEKYPLTYSDLAQSLACWQHNDPTLTPLIQTLLKQYPTLVAGCHRLHLADDVTLDLWLGDGADSLACLDTTYGAKVNAWFLDGFAPACNESLWADRIFLQLKRLSCAHTTVATFSCAGVVKRGLKSAGFDIQKVAGFGRKKHMLTGIMPAQNSIHPNKADDSKRSNSHLNIHHLNISQQNINDETPTLPHCVTIIGAGISGLMSAWALAQRGVRVHLLDKSAPLAGASGNPRALLAPKMTPIHHVAQHLHSISYLYSSRFYRQLNQAANTLQTAPIFEATATLDLLTKANVDVQQIRQYPDEMATTLDPMTAQQYSGIIKQDLSQNLYLPQAGLVNPQALAKVVLAHPLITFKQAEVLDIEVIDTEVIDTEVLNSENSTTSKASTGSDKPFDKPLPPSVRLQISKNNEDTANHHETFDCNVVIIAAAYASCLLDNRIFDYRKIRGQLSWFTPTSEQLARLPKLPLKYGGYCTPFIAQQNDDGLNEVGIGKPQFLLGASFVRNDTDLNVRDGEHLINRNKLITALPYLDNVLPNEVTQWQARVGIRAQTPDYHPSLGCLEYDDFKSSSHSNGSLNGVWTLSGMGSKGFAFAPLCAQALADMLTGNFAPLSADMLARLSPQRASLKTVLTE